MELTEWLGSMRLHFYRFGDTISSVPIASANDRMVSLQRAIAGPRMALAWPINQVGSPIRDAVHDRDHDVPIRAVAYRHPAGIRRPFRKIGVSRGIERILYLFADLVFKPFPRNETG